MKGRKILTISVLAIVAIVLAVGIALATPSGRAMYDRFCGPFKALKLNTEQLQKGRAIMREAKKESLAVLNPAQRELVEMHRGGYDILSRLQLTPAQQTKITAIRSAAKTKAEAVKGNAKLSESDKHAQLNAIREETRKQIQPVLTADQQAKFKAEIEQHGSYAMLSKLQLTPDQQTKIAAIRSAAKTKVEAINGDAKLSESDKHAQLSAIREDTWKQIQPVLTTDQQVKLKTEKANMCKECKSNAFLQRQQKFVASLNLTAEQKTKLTAIKDKAVHDFRQLLDLNQQKTFDKMHAKYEAHFSALMK